jgi:chemotaxis protein MotA
MDYLSIAGILLGLGAILGGNWWEGGHVSSLANGPALLIVLGGTCGAMLLQTPQITFIRGLKMLRWLFFPPAVDLRGQIAQVVAWSTQARKEGLLGLEELLVVEKDPFAKKGLQMLVDGNEGSLIRESLEVDMQATEHFDTQAAKIFEAMGGYSPTVGIIGAVMGLIHVMQNLTDPSKLGSGIATAFVATIYGVGLANLFLLPVAAKLKSHVHAQAQRRELIIEGLIAIADGENPKRIEAKLEGFIQSS